MSRATVFEAVCSRTGNDQFVTPQLVRATSVVYDPPCRYIATTQTIVPEVVGGE